MVSAIAPNMGAHIEVSSIDMPLLNPHIISPKFLGYIAWLATTLVKNTGKMRVIITTAKDVLARSYRAHDIVGSLTGNFKLSNIFFNLSFFTDLPVAVCNFYCLKVFVKIPEICYINGFVAIVLKNDIKVTVIIQWQIAIKLQTYFKRN